jgi:site-specific recombinase XerD
VRRFTASGGGGRLSTRAASDIFRTILANSGLDDEITAHTGRHNCATTLIRGGTDLVLVAEYLGATRTTRPAPGAKPVQGTGESLEPRQGWGP